MVQQIAYVGLGSNVGNKIANCARALTELSSPDISIQRVSSLYKTDPVGYVDQERFVNGVVEVCTELSIRSLLERVKIIEKNMGRKTGVRWGPRVIDLDILLYGSEVCESEDLVIPHPRLHERRFVLVPLVELVPEFMHPGLNKTMRELLAAVGNNQYVERCSVTPLECVSGNAARP